MTNHDPRLAPASEIGIDEARLEELFGFVEQQVTGDQIQGAQVAIASQGRLAGFRSYGSSHQGTTLDPVRDDTLFCMFSSTKAVVGVGAWCLIDDGLLSLDEKIVDIIPGWCAEGGSVGYETITVQQVMLHTGGFPHAPMNPRLWEDREARNRRMMGWRLNWEPDSQWEYHATAAHWVLAEIINQRTGRDFREWLRERLLDPLQLDNLYVGLPNEEHDRAASIIYTEQPLPPDGGEVFPRTILHFNLASQRRAGCPGGGGFANAADIAMFYQALVAPAGDDDDRPQTPIRPETIELATTVQTDPQRHTDPLSGIPVNRGLTVVLAGDDGHSADRGFGNGASPRAFGHGGAGGQVTWGDPETGLSVAFLTNSFQQDEQIRARTAEIGTLAAACVVYTEPERSHGLPPHNLPVGATLVVALPVHRRAHVNRSAARRPRSAYLVGDWSPRQTGTGQPQELPLQERTRPTRSPCRGNPCGCPPRSPPRTRQSQPRTSPTLR